MNSPVIDLNSKPTAGNLTKCLDIGFAKHKKSLTVSPELFLLTFKRSERWQMERLMNKSMDIKSFLVLLGKYPDSEIFGYKVLLGWAENIIRAGSATKADKKKLREQATELVHSFILDKVPIISNRIVENRGIFNQYQIARYVKKSLFNYYKSYRVRELSLEDRLKREQRLREQQLDKGQKFRSTDYNRLEELKKQNCEMPKDGLDQEWVVECLLHNRGNYVIYNLMTGLPDRVKRYILYASTYDENIYAPKSPDTIRKERSRSRQDLKDFLTRHEITESKFRCFLQSLHGQDFMTELRRQFGAGNA